MDNSQKIGDISNSSLYGVNINSSTVSQDKYTEEEFIKKIESGEIKLSVEQIKGLHGGTYSRNPSTYNSSDGDWGYTEFTVNHIPYIVATFRDKNNVEWFHLPMLLRAIGILSQEFSDISAFGRLIPFSLKRFYQPFGKGIKRIFINREAFEQLGLSVDGKPKIKKKYNIEYTGIVTLNINIEAVERSFIKIMNKLKSIEDRAILCDVHRILKQIQ